MYRAQFYPDEQVDSFWNFLMSRPSQEKPNSKNELRLQMLFLTDENKICMSCQNRNAQKYIRCPRCELYYYCSEECLTRDRAIHQDECQNTKLPQNKVRYGMKFCIVDTDNKKLLEF